MTHDTYVEDWTAPIAVQRGNVLAPIAGEIVCDGPPLPCHICAGAEKPCPTCRCVLCEERHEDDAGDGLCGVCRGEREQRLWDSVHGSEARYER